MQCHVAAIANHDFVPPEALSTEKLDGAAVEEALAKDASLLVDALMDIEAPLLVDAVNGEKGLAGTEASQVMLGTFSPATTAMHAETPASSSAT